MRQTFVVSYDVSDSNRLRKVYRLMRGWGEHIQLSVFRCELNARELVQMRLELSLLINHKEDQVLFIDIGPVDGRGSCSIRSIGQAYVSPERTAIVV